MKTLSRQELYDLIWSKPMTKASKEMGISDVGLRKICIKHEIPTPEVGYWAKKAHGKKVLQTPLPEPRNLSLKNIQILGSNVSRLASDLQTKLSALESKTPTASTEGIPLHKIFSRTIKKLEQKKPDNSGLITLKGPKYINCTVGRENTARLILFLKKFHTALHVAGVNIANNDNSEFLEFEGEHIAFSITEKLDKRPHQVTNKEQSKLDRWEKNRDPRDWVYKYGRPQIPEWDYHPSGKLTFKIEYLGYDGLRRSFSDAKIQTLESVLPEIVVGIQACAIAKKHRREEHEKQAREWEIQRRKQEQARQLKALENKRITQLSELLSHWEKANNLRDLGPCHAFCVSAGFTYTRLIDLRTQS